MSAVLTPAAPTQRTHRQPDGDAAGQEAHGIEDRYRHDLVRVWPV